MGRNGHLNLSLGVALVLGMALLVPSAEAGEIRIGGTGGALGLMKRLAVEYAKKNPSVSIKVIPSLGSSGGIKAVSAGALGLAVSSRKPDEKEPGLAASELASTPFVFAVRKSDPMTGIGKKELVELYAGRKLSWPDGRAVRVVLRPVTEYDTTLLRSMSPEMDNAVMTALGREGMIVAVTDQDSADAIEKIPGSLGTTTLGQIRTEERQLKVLILDGTRPGLDTVANRTYPYVKSYWIVTRPDPGADIRAFLEFVRSPGARKLMSSFGYQAAVP